MSILNDYFLWNGVNSTSLGIHVLEQPPVTLPSERVKYTNVPGKAGSLTTLEGDDVYEDITLTATCIVRNMDRLDEIAAFLKGSGKVTFANRQGGFYYARIANQIPFDVILRGNPHRSFAVNFRCKPFFYLDNSPTTTITRSGTFLTNPGCVSSEPIITITGSGDISLIIGMQIRELTGVEGTITIDTALQEVYKGTASCNEKLDGDFPILVPGPNAISWDGNVSSVVVQPNWRTL